MCKCCVIGVDGKLVCVICTPAYVTAFVTANFERYKELYQQIMKSLSHVQNVVSALAAYENHKSNVLDTKLIEMIISLALHTQIKNRKYITIKHSQV